MNFYQDYVHFRARLQEAMTDAFHMQEEFDALGHTADIFGSFEMQEEKRILGLMPTKSFTHAHEYRFLFPDASLDERRLQEWWDKALALEDEFVKPDDTHEFSVVSLIVVTDAFPKPLHRVLKKFKGEHFFRNQGWSSVRLAVVDLSEKKAYTNHFGSPLKNVVSPFLKNDK